MPGSHKPEAVAAIQSYREEQGVDWESMEDDEQRNFTDALSACDLVISVVTGEEAASAVRMAGKWLRPGTL